MGALLILHFAHCAWFYPCASFSTRRRIVTPPLLLTQYGVKHFGSTAFWQENCIARFCSRHPISIVYGKHLNPGDVEVCLLLLLLISRTTQT